jgi:enamine deaminase RidA (YjgF/YER057c/UK114 family)
MEGVADDYAKQSKIIWENCVGILKELGAGMKDVIHKTVYFR